MTHSRHTFNYRTFTLAVGCLAAAFLSHASAEPTTQSKSTVHPGDVNTQVSRVYTFVDKTGLGHQHAIEGKLVSGNLKVGASVDAGQMVFDMNSYDADTERARRYIGLEGTTGESTRSQVNANMRGRYVLDVVDRKSVV